MASRRSTLPLAATYGALSAFVTITGMAGIVVFLLTSPAANACEAPQATSPFAQTAVSVQVAETTAGACVPINYR